MYLQNKSPDSSRGGCETCETMPVQNVLMHRPSETEFDLTQHITIPVVQSRTALC